MNYSAPCGNRTSRGGFNIRGITVSVDSWEERAQQGMKGAEYTNNHLDDKPLAYGLFTMDIRNEGKDG